MRSDLRVLHPLLFWHRSIITLFDQRFAGITYKMVFRNLIIHFLIKFGSSRGKTFTRLYPFMVRELLHQNTATQLWYGLRDIGDESQEYSFPTQIFVLKYSRSTIYRKVIHFRDYVNHDVQTIHENQRHSFYHTKLVS